MNILQYKPFTSIGWHEKVHVSLHTEVPTCLNVLSVLTLFKYKNFGNNIQIKHCNVANEGGLNMAMLYNHIILHAIQGYSNMPSKFQTHRFDLNLHVQL